MSNYAEKNQENIFKWLVRYVLIPVSLAVITGLFALEVIDREIASRPPIGEDPVGAIFATMTAVAGQAQPEETAIPEPSSTLTLSPTPTEEASVDETPVVETDSASKINPGDTAVCGVVPAGWRLYTVKPGNTLFSLARESGTSIAAIRQANCLYGQLLAYSQIWLPPFSLDDVVTLTKEPVTITPTVTVTEPVALPDLINDTLEWPRVDEYCSGSSEECVTTVALAVSNTGAAGAGPFTVLVKFDPEQSVMRTQSFEGLAAGERVEFSVSGPVGNSCYDPICTVCLTVDSDDGVIEESEVNNSYCATFFGKG